MGATPRPFSAGSVLVTRTGDGRTPLAASHVSREAFVDEVNPSTGEIIQSIRFPDGAPVWDAAGNLAGFPGCTLTSQYVTDGMPARAADGTFVAFACYSQGLYAAIGTAGVRQIVRFNPDGSFASQVLFSSGASQVRGLATVDGSWYYVGSSYGVYAVKSGVNPGGAANITVPVYVTPTTGLFRGMASLAGGIYAGTATSGIAQVQLVGGAAGVSAGPTVSPAPAPLSLPGLPNGAGGTAAIYFESPTVLWVTDWQNSASMLSKYTRASGDIASFWSTAPGYPKSSFVTVNGTVLSTEARGLTGWTDPGTGTFYLLVATGAGLLKFDPTTGYASVLLASCVNTAMKGVALSPALPSNTPTLTPSRTASPPVTPSLTITPSVSASPTPTRSPSATITPSITASSSATMGSTSSSTGSISASGSQTPASTPSGSQTASVTAASTGTATNTATLSGSKTVTPPATRTSTMSITASNTATMSISKSNTGTPSLPASPSGTSSVTSSASLPPTGTSSTTGSITGSQTPSLTASQTGTPSSSRTASQTGTPSSSGTGTGTASVSLTSSPTGSVAPSSTASTSARPSQSATKSTQPSPSATKTRTRSASGSRTKTRTKTKVRAGINSGGASAFSRTQFAIHNHIN